MTASSQRRFLQAIAGNLDHAATTSGNATRRQCLATSTAALALLFVGAAHAAGGHHAVDDAALLEPGQCQLETWWDGETGGARTLLHAGPGCRVGPFEIAVSIDHTRHDYAGSTAITGLQMKWARILDDGWSVGIAVAANGQNRAPHYLGSTVIVPVTWQATPTLLTHVNIGRDFRRSEADTFHGGVALEWTPRSDWTFVAERFKEVGNSFRRAGIRWTLSPAASIDLSRARAVGADSRAWWTVGLTWVWN